MRDKSHIEQVERWANFVRDNPDKWKESHTLFINAQIQKANDFYSKIKDKKLLNKLRKIE